MGLAPGSYWSGLSERTRRPASLGKLRPCHRHDQQIALWLETVPSLRRRSGERRSRGRGAALSEMISGRAPGANGLPGEVGRSLLWMLASAMD